MYYHTLTHPNPLAGWDLVPVLLCSDVPKVHYIDDVLVVKPVSMIDGSDGDYYLPLPEVDDIPELNSELCLPSSFSTLFRQSHNT